ncbi:ketoacyl-ACP synthase III family protein [Actinokineospora sp. PR83]|uniref:ketoacyl-ACP synthase III family protein n=1 Tax=Actinokineospora sp. PR83 TaxID=2884908 RepID=UPI001F1DA4F3|nr:ketoacyl-ACP synthase III family protein [Actinokineospora sp. PR83]MCG8915753.1 ketoacyl-ACP synthase III family protein [Actinokineospora sp. PR83]
MRTDGIHLAGLGTVVPERVSTEHAVERGWYDAAAREASGILSVSVAGNRPAPDMAVEAVGTALRGCAHHTDDFGVLLHSHAHHQGPDAWSPAHYILNNTLDRPVPAIEVRQGCLGGLAALELAVTRLVANPSHPAALVTAADNFSVPLVDRWRTSSAFLLADSAAAVAVSRTGGFARLLAIGSVSDARMEVLDRGGDPLFPPGVTLGVPLDFDRRREHVRRLWARGVAPPIGYFGDKITEVVDAVLEDAGITLDEVARVAHPGFGWESLDAMFLAPLGIDADRGVWEHIRRIGHAGVTEVFLGLDHLWRSGQVGPGDHVLLVSSGAGASMGAAVVRILTAPPEVV